MSQYADSDDERIEIECSKIINSLSAPLFKVYRRVSGASMETFKVDNVTLYAVTINPDPFCLFNKKMYKKYTHDQQRAMLTRIENALRKEYKDIELKELHFEVCPNLKQVHFHALYEMRESMTNLYKEYMKKRCVRPNSPSWRFYDCQEVYNRQGWLEYIRKSIE